MDMLTVDLSGLAGEGIGSLVELWGAQVPVGTVAPSCRHHRLRAAVQRQARAARLLLNTPRFDSRPCWLMEVRFERACDGCARRKGTCGPGAALQVARSARSQLAMLARLAVLREPSSPDRARPCGALRSNNCDESEHEARVSFGHARGRLPCASRRSTGAPHRPAGAFAGNDGGVPGIGCRAPVNGLRVFHPRMQHSAPRRHLNSSSQPASKAPWDVLVFSNAAHALRPPPPPPPAGCPSPARVGDRVHRARLTSSPIAPMQPTRNVSTCVSLPG